jgi:thiosulfate/3-mercaptopyruvate sulfurtransferase
MRPLALAPTVLWAATLAAQARVSPGWLAEHRNDAGLVVIHTAMDRSSYEQGHVPGARFVSAMSFHGRGTTLPPAEEIGKTFAAAGVSDQSRIVLTGDVMSNAITFVALDYIGAGNRVSILDGGLAAWRAASLPLSQDSVVSQPATLHAAPRTDMIVDADWIAARLERRGNVALVDARSKAEYDGTTTAERLPRFGHIPGAGHVDWRATFRAGTDELLPVDSLRAKLAAAGVAAGDTVVAYCTIGMRASHLYLVARQLGIPARLYVGSMADWSRREALPMVSAKGEKP